MRSRPWRRIRWGIGEGVRMQRFFLTNMEQLLYGTGTIKPSGPSAPDSSGFFVPSVGCSLPMRRVDRAEYNTRKGNKPSRLGSVVETRRLSNAVQPLKTKEAQR